MPIVYFPFTAVEVTENLDKFSEKRISCITPNDENDCVILASLSLWRPQWDITVCSSQNQCQGYVSNPANANQTSLQQAITW